MPKQLLDLSTLAPERPVVAIDGAAYEMLVPDDLGLLVQTRLERLQRKVQALVDQPTSEDETENDSQVEALEDALHEAVSILLPDLPTETRNKLRDNQCLAIMQAFTAAVGEKKTKAKAPRPIRPIGGSRSRVSNDSTAEGTAIG